MSTRRKGIRRPSKERGSSGLFLFFFFLLFIALGGFFLGTSSGRDLLFNFLYGTSNEELLQSLESGNKELRTEIDLLKARTRISESTMDDYKIKTEDLKREIKFLKRGIEEKEEELGRQDNNPISNSRKTISQENKDKIRPSRKDEPVYREVNLSRAEKLVRGPKVTYPRQAINRDLTGKVNIRFDVSKKGIPINIRVISSTSPVFNKAAIDAVEKMVYLPARDKNGNEIMVKNIDYPFRFELK